MDPLTLTNNLKDAARALGFALAGACPARDTLGHARLSEWLERGYAGEMDYLAKRVDAYRHPESVLPGVRSLLMLGMSYRSLEPNPVAPGQGRISRYAWSGGDYHDPIQSRLKELVRRLGEWAPGSRSRGVVDTAPLLEREFAELAGLGWIGKHTLTLNRQSGSWFFLAAVLTDVELAYDPPHAVDYCGTCTACLDACPTQAFPEPGVLDARRCVSYLTIEHRGAIPVELRTGLGDWLFGCDVCQEVCPWNRRAPTGDVVEWGPRADLATVDLVELLRLDDAEFRQRFRGTPLWRAKRRGVLRNAAIVLGNQRREAAVDALGRALEDEESLVRGAAAWALGRIGSPAARRYLAARQVSEPDEEVRSEIAGALIDSAAVSDDSSSPEGASAASAISDATSPRLAK